MAEKLHAACDECRTRKLKCSGGSPACSRCQREKIGCVYSPQKPMGRPRKRRRDDVPEEGSQEGQAELSPEGEGFPMAVFAEGGLVPQGDLHIDFPGFEGVAVDDVFPQVMASQPYIETNTGSYGQVPALDASFGAGVIDPSLWNQQTPDDSGFNSTANSTSGQPDNGPCSCLSLMYLSITDLQSLNNFSFPSVVLRLRPALTTASTMLHCPKCPQDTFNALQNLQNLHALLFALAERFHKVLSGIDAEAARLAQAGEKKPFRVGDNSPENMHLHTGGLNCPMGYDLRLDAADWKKLAKQMLRTEVLGGGHNPTPLLALIEELEARQQTWHFDKEMHVEERTRMFGEENMCKRKDEALCLKMVGQLRVMVDKMDWD